MKPNVVAAILLIIGLFAVPGARAATLSPVQTINAGGHARTFYYYRPDNFDPSKGMIMFLHGGGGNGASSAAGGTDSLWTKLADRIGVLVLFPEGKPNTNDATSHSWNDCNDTTRTRAPSYTNWDDVGFIKALIPWAKTNISGSLDATRVYAAGESNGGQMVERLALEANDAIAAVGNLAGNLAVSNDNSGTYKCQGYTAPWAAGTSQAVPIFLVKGDADPRIPFGATDDFGNPTQTDHNNYCQIKDPNGPNPPCADGAVHSYFDTLAFWEWKLGISSSPTRRVPATSSVYYADTVSSCDSNFTSCDGSFVLRHNLGSSPFRLVFLRVRYGGHAFPGPDVQTQASYDANGWKNRDALGQANPYIAEEMWAFFTQFTLAN